MNAATLTIDDQVDAVLHKIALSASLTLSPQELYDVPVMNERTYRLDHFMLEKGLLKIAGENRVITSKGLEIANFGGWVSYQKQLRREKPRNIYAVETLQIKYESEIGSLRNQIERYKQELRSKSIKDGETSRIIKNLIEQNKSSKLMYFISGIGIGIVLASILSYLLF